jgi:signal transduction histidine kinase
MTRKTFNENCVAFCVADNTPGIEPKFHKRIFQTFHSHDVIESSGMGLAIIKKVVEGQGGETTIASALGKGSVLHSAGPQIRHAVSPLTRWPNLVCHYTSRSIGEA